MRNDPCLRLLNKVLPLFFSLSLLVLLPGCAEDEQGPGPVKPPPIIVGEQVFVPAGLVVLGDTPAGYGNYVANSNPVQVDSFYVDRFEVSNQDYVQFLNPALESGSVFLVNGNVYDDTLATGKLLLELTLPQVRIDFVDTLGQFIVDAGYEYLPVIGVSWYGAFEYAQFFDLRLPTEEEWEKAARGVSDYYGTLGGVGVGFRYPWDNDLPEANLANFNNRLGGPEEVDAYDTGVSWYGAYNLAGNVDEWTATAIGSQRIYRGGSYLSASEYSLRTGTRYVFDPVYTSAGLGFRCASDSAVSLTP